MSNLSTPLISVILPICKECNHLSQSLNSILEQSLINIELICVIDTIEKSDLETLCMYANEDNRVTIITHHFTTIGSAYNVGLKSAKGTYVTFINSGDYYPDNQTFERLYNEAISQDVNIVGGSLALFYYRHLHTDLDDEIKGCRFEKAELIQYKDYQSDNAFQRFIYKVSFLRENSIKFPDIDYFYGSLFMVKAMVKASIIYVIPDITYCRRGNIAWMDVKDLDSKQFREFLKGILLTLRISHKEKLDLLHIHTWKQFWDTEYRSTYATALARHNYDTIKIFLLLFREIDFSTLKKNGVKNLGQIRKLKEESEVCLKKYSRLLQNTNTNNLHGNVAVSIIMPSLNVEPYIRLCIESVMQQSLVNIEILCVDAGSTDGTLEILQEYASIDSRIKIIKSEKKSYGYQVNLGIKNACGEYVGIVETDDYISSDMYSELYQIASAKKLEAVKGDFIIFYGKDDKEWRYRNITQDYCYNREISGLQMVKEFPRNLSSPMCIWAGIYQTAFLKKYNIFCQETSGASFQDNGFWFLLLINVKRMMFVKKPYYYLRRNNPNSSVLANNKTYCMKEEYDYIHHCIRQIVDEEKKGLFLKICAYYRFRNYSFTYNRIPELSRLKYLTMIQKEFVTLESCGELDISIMLPEEQRKLTEIMEDPVAYYETDSYIKTRSLSGLNYNQYKTNSKLKRTLKRIGEELISVEENGYKYTIKKISNIISKKVRISKNMRGNVCL